jgi:hypothetical protein
VAEIVAHPGAYPAARVGPSRADLLTNVTADA